LTSASHHALDQLRAAGCRVIFSTPGKQPDEEELIDLLPGCEGYLAGVERISARVLLAAKRKNRRTGTFVLNVHLFLIRSPITGCGPDTTICITQKLITSK